MSFIEASARMLTIGDTPGRVFDEGEGSVVVVLHGWGGRIESMAPVLDCLRVDHRVIALDLPGFGAASPPPVAWGTPEYARFVADALAELGVNKAHFLGHSFGGKIALYLAATVPGLVDRLVLSGASGLRSAPSFKVRTKRALSRIGRIVGRLGPVGRALRAALYRRIASEDYRSSGALRPILVKVVNEDLAELLPRVSSPTLLVWGTEDAAVPLSHARIFEAGIPDAGLVTFEGAGHFAYLDEADRFCAIVRNFFGRP